MLTTVLLDTIAQQLWRGLKSANPLRKCGEIGVRLFHHILRNVTRRHAQQVTGLHVQKLQDTTAKS